MQGEKRATEPWGNTTMWGPTREPEVREANRKGSQTVQGKSGPPCHGNSGKTQTPER